MLGNAGQAPLAERSKQLSGVGPGWGVRVRGAVEAHIWISDPISQGQQKRLGEGNLLDLHQQREAARRKAREEKARQARRAAIQVPGAWAPCE